MRSRASSSCFVLVDNRGASDSTASDFPAAATEYDGPLYVAEGRYGAAGHTLDCPRPAADREYAYVGTPSSVDAWPRFDSGCA